MTTDTSNDLAYNNSAAVADSAAYAANLPVAAAAMRDDIDAVGSITQDHEYGNEDRQTLDLFSPQTDPVGLVVFIHGGYWMRFDKSAWSHLARGVMQRGWQMAIPSYTLCPDASIADITNEVGDAITAADDLTSNCLPIRLVGHSAGGHLVSRMMCTNTPLSDSIMQRVAKTMSVSGVHDLRPLLKTAMNDTLGLDLKSAREESPVLLEPVAGKRITCWVGADELSEFVRQSSLLANLWQSLGAQIDAVAEPGKNHFTVIEGLAQRNSPLVEKLLS